MVYTGDSTAELSRAYVPVVCDLHAGSLKPHAHAQLLSEFSKVKNKMQDISSALGPDMGCNAKVAVGWCYVPFDQLHTASFSALQVSTCEVRRKLAVLILDARSLSNINLGTTRLYSVSVTS